MYIKETRDSLYVRLLSMTNGMLLTIIVQKNIAIADHDFTHSIGCFAHMEVISEITYPYNLIFNTNSLSSHNFCFQNSFVTNFS